MNTDDLTHDDCLAHAALADVLGHGLHPWVCLDDETHSLAHQALARDCTADFGRQLLREQPDFFARWLARENAALERASNAVEHFLPGTVPNHEVLP